MTKSMIEVVPRKAGRRSGKEIIAGDRAHEGHFQMGVRVDAAGHDQQAISLHDVTAGGRGDIGGDGGNLPLVIAQDIGLECTIGRNNRAAFYMKHDRTLSPVGWRAFRTGLSFHIGTVLLF
ncbi:hypothetical protein RAA17_13270 [Komagataeibacter rhaeticus]|nr:hypothetical protein [Komagataeibacter rhaeticus]